MKMSDINMEQQSSQQLHAIIIKNDVHDRIEFFFYTV